LGNYETPAVISKVGKAKLAKGEPLDMTVYGRKEFPREIVEEGPIAAIHGVVRWRLFGAVCPERGAGAALVLPACNTEAMQLHLDEIATKITPGAHAILLLDQAGWHGAKAL
jgi:hypothetical protein